MSPHLTQSRASRPHASVSSLALGGKGAQHVPSKVAHPGSAAPGHPGTSSPDVPDRRRPVRTGRGEPLPRADQRRRRDRRRPRRGRQRHRRGGGPQPAGQPRLRERALRLDVFRRIRRRRRQSGARRLLRAQGHAGRLGQRPVHPDGQRAAQLAVHAERLRPGQLHLPGRHRHGPQRRPVHLDAEQRHLQPAQRRLQHRAEHHLGDGLPARLVRTARVLRGRRGAQRPRRHHHAAHHPADHSAHDAADHPADDASHHSAHHPADDAPHDAADR